MPYEEQIVTALLAIQESMGGMRSDIRTLYKKVEDIQEERRRADEVGDKELRAITGKHDILSDRIGDIEEVHKRAKWIARLGLLLAAVLGGSLGSKVSGWISKIWPG